MTLLLVDDHEPFRRRARAMLEAGGFDVIAEAADAASAVMCARTLGPQVVVLDIMLPDGNGFDVAALLAAFESPPIVVLTSSRDAGDYGTRLTRSRVHGFIPKHELGARALLDMVGSPA